MKKNEFFRVWKQVFSNWKYLLLTIIIATIFYSLNVFTSSYSSIISFYNATNFLSTLGLFFELFLGFQNTTVLHSFVSLIIISILFGILFSLIIYKTKMIKNIEKGKTGFLASVGIFLGILAPGCAACGIGLLSVFGIGAATLSLLPFDGLEISILSILILGFVTFKITKDINKGIVCKIK
jgi:hypothetical protein